MEMKWLTCRDHGGSFQVPVKRGRPPVVCKADNPCNAIASGGRKRAQATDTPRTGSKTTRGTNGAQKPAQPVFSPAGEVTKVEKTATGRKATHANGSSVEIVIGEDDMRGVAAGVRKNSSPGIEFDIVYPARRGKSDPELCSIHAPGCRDIAKGKGDTVVTETLSLQWSTRKLMGILDPDDLGYEWSDVAVMECAKVHAMPKPSKPVAEPAEIKARTVAKRAAKPEQNPCIPLAHAVRAKLEPHGWNCKGKAYTEDGRTHAEVIATRGEEMITLMWADGELISQDYSLWNMEKPSVNNAPKHSLPFDPDEMSDKELIQALAGKTVTWWNRLGSKRDEAAIPTTKIRIEHHFDGLGDETPGDRIVTFVDPSGGGFRSFRVGALLKISK